MSNQIIYLCKDCRNYSSCVVMTKIWDGTLSPVQDCVCESKCNVDVVTGVLKNKSPAEFRKEGGLNCGPGGLWFERKEQ